MSYALRGGHNYGVTGANGLVNEVAIDRIIYPLVIKWLRLGGEEVTDVTPVVTNTSAEDLKYGVDMANNIKASYFASIHLNASNGLGNGSEALYQSEAGRVIAVRISAKLASLGFRNRGAKPNTRGLYELLNTNCVANIIEVFFCDNAADVALYNSLGADAIAKAIAEGMLGRDIVVDTKQYIISDYLPQGQYGVEINEVINKYFSGLDRIYVHNNATGIWIETQYLTKEQCDVISNKLKVDNLLYKVVIE